nr:MAG: replication associated protein [ssDNA virus sp.]
MSTNLMFTHPNGKFWKAQFRKMIDELDVHKWVVGFEVGKDGYRHLQGRLRVSMGETEAFMAVKKYLPMAHIEKCSDTWEYERKSGRFLSSEDTPEIRAVRFGQPRDEQVYWMTKAEDQGNRGITVVFDKQGNHGKSWLCNWLFERNIGFYVPPTIDTVKGMIQWIASGYDHEPFIVIDIPRSWKWSEQLYVAIESIKDGLVYDTRYHSQIRNIRGVKVIVFTNEYPKLGKLSEDRWDIIEAGGEPQS